MIDELFIITFLNYLVFLADATRQESFGLFHLFQGGSVLLNTSTAFSK